MHDALSPLPSPIVKIVNAAVLIQLAELDSNSGVWWPIPIADRIFSCLGIVPRRLCQLYTWQMYVAISALCNILEHTSLLTFEFLVWSRPFVNNRRVSAARIA